jgi:beta-galactosidase
VEAFERELSARGVPFAHVDGETAGPALAGARWIICPTAGGIDPGLWAELQRRRAEGARITIGPRVPARDGSLRPFPEPLDRSGMHLVPMSGPHPQIDGTLIDEEVEAALLGLELPVWTIRPKAVSLAVHEDGEKTPRVLFVINPTPLNEEATVVLDRRATLTDMFDQSRHDCPEDGGVIFAPARSVRMFRIDLT